MTRLGQSTFVAGGNNQIAAFAGQRAGYGQADAAIGAGDEGETAGERGLARCGFVLRHAAVASLCQPPPSFERGVSNSAIAPRLIQGGCDSRQLPSCARLGRQTTPAREKRAVWGPRRGRPSLRGNWAGAGARPYASLPIKPRSFVGGSGTEIRFLFPLRGGSSRAWTRLPPRNAVSRRLASSCTDGGLR